MHLVILFYIITSIVADSFPKSNWKSISDLEVNLFHTINTKLHNTMNKLFTSLAINKNFKNKDIVQLLTTMHSNLQTKSENNYKIFKDIEFISKVGTVNETVKALFNLKEVFEEVFPEKYSILHNSTIVEDILFNKTDSNVKNHTSIECNSTSEESLEFIKDFLIKVEKLTLEDIIVPANSTEERNDTKHKIRRNYNLKAWRAPNSSNELPNSRRIYKGQKTMVKKYPFMASIHLMEEFVCAGSIISKDFVLTAATCMHVAYNNILFHTKSNTLKARIGSDFTQRFGELIPIIEVHFHPAYNPVHLSHNLAVGRMMKHLSFKKINHKIRRIDYERAKSALTKDMKEITILGWGDKDANVRNNYQQLSLAHLNIYDLDDCMQIYSRDYVSDTNICAGFLEKGGGACNRDVGGPGVVKGILVGVVSFGPPVCGTPDGPTVFTRLAHYADWIDSIVNSEQQTALVATTITEPNTESQKNMLTKETDIDVKKRSFPKGLNMLANIIRQLLVKGNVEADDYLYDFKNQEKEAFLQEEHAEEFPRITKGIFLLEDIITPNPNESTATTRATTSLFDAYTQITLDDVAEMYSIKDLVAPFFTPDIRMGHSETKTTKINMYKGITRGALEEIDKRSKNNVKQRENVVEDDSGISSEISDNYEDDETQITEHSEYSDKGLRIALQKAHKIDKIQPKKASPRHKSVEYTHNATANIDDIVFLILGTTKTTKKRLRSRFRQIKPRKVTKSTRMVKLKSYAKSSTPADKTVPWDSDEDEKILRNTMKAAYNDEDVYDEQRDGNDKKIENYDEKRKKNFLDYINIF